MFSQNRVSQHRWRSAMLLMVMLAAALSLLFLIFEGLGGPRKEKVTKAEAVAVKGGYTMADLDAYTVLQGVASLADLTEGLWVSGAIGAGKSSSVGALTAVNVLAHPSRPGALFLTAKAGEFEKIRHYANLAGRASDLIRFAPGLETCDLLNCALSHPEATVDAAAKLLNDLAEVDRRGESQGGGGGSGDGSFWDKYAARMLRSAISLVYYGTGKVSITDVYAVLNEAPDSLKAASSAEWQEDSFVWACYQQGKARGAACVDFNRAVNFYTSEWPRTGERQRVAGATMVLGFIDAWMGGPMAAMLSGGVSSCPPEKVVDEHKIVCCDMPMLQWGISGQLFQTAYRVLVQKAALRRKGSSLPTPVLVFMDEYQLYSLPRHDAWVQSVAREARLVNVILTQSIPILRAAVGGDGARDLVDSLLGNFSVKCMCANSCVETNTYASRLCGSSYRDEEGGSMPYEPPYDTFLAPQDRPPVAGPSLSWQTRYLPDLYPEAWTSLRRGGEGVVEAIAFRNGKPFPSTGKPWRRVFFPQVEVPRDEE